MFLKSYGLFINTRIQNIVSSQRLAIEQAQQPLKTIYLIHVVKKTLAIH